ncbi:MAG: hypothetical protein JRI91_04555 [Deltaproteobacteria bacterium]|nr:hypothetical protein [Deltaproteobacteria bacterium]
MNSLIKTSVNHYQVQPEAKDSLKEIKYEGLFIKNENKLKKHCILMLSGTSTQLADIDYFISHLVDREYSIASIERFIGGPFNIWIKPKLERKEALKHFICQLKENHNIEKIDIIAHSYAPFEVIRLLIDAPELYRKYVGNILFINPAGFNDNIKYIPHCLRFSFIFIMKEYGSALVNLLRKGTGDKFLREFYLNKLRAITSLFLKTIQNPVRTFKEVADIVSFKLSFHVKNLIELYGYNFHFFLNTGDELVNVSKTLQQIKELVPEKRIMTFSGNHLDILIHKNQIKLFLNYLDKIMVIS